jgi:patatin-like phospholipase/acyl hydrolase
VEELTGKPIWQSFDLIAGTSTGGLIASALTLPKHTGVAEAKYSIKDIMDVYLQRGQEIFPPKKNAIGRFFNSANATINPKYSDKGIDKVFRDVCGNAKMNDALTHLLVCTYDLTNNVPLFFKTRSSKKHPDQNIEIYDICRATSAGPTYLPAYELKYPNNGELPDRLCIDGGVFVNNPSMAALSEFSKHYKEYGYESKDNDIQYEDVFVLSIGTGSYYGRITPQEAKYKGELFWATRISDVMMKGVNKTTDYGMKEMMVEGNYLRLTITIAKEEYSEMARADDEAAKYLIGETYNQVLNKKEEMDKLKDFLIKAELMSNDLV